MSDEADRYAKMQAIFEGARSRSGAERTAYLRERCADDTALLDRVHALLAAAETRHDDDPYRRGPGVPHRGAVGARGPGRNHMEPNPFGLHHVLGNVGELCLVGFPRHYARDPLLDPVEPPGGSDGRAVRGGSIHESATHARAARRYGIRADTRILWIGVRPGRQLTR